MKITKTKLKQIIKEELETVLEESEPKHPSAWHGHVKELQRYLTLLERALDLVEKHGKSLDDPMTTLKFGVGKGQYEEPQHHKDYRVGGTTTTQNTIGNVIQDRGYSEKLKQAYDIISLDYDRYSAGSDNTNLGSYCKEKPDRCAEYTNYISGILERADETFKRLEKY
jgi:hypothetical protein